MSKTGNHILDLEDQGRAPYQNIAEQYAAQFVSEAHQKLVESVRQRKVHELRVKIAKQKKVHQQNDR